MAASLMRKGDPFLSSENEDQNENTVFIVKKGVQQHFSPGEFVRPLDSVEILMCIGSLLESCNAVQAIWLNSKQAIRPNDVIQSLWIMLRQNPHMQLCLCRRGLKMWFKRMETSVIDFEATMEDVMEIFHRMVNEKKDMFKGPLWSAKIVYLKHEPEKPYSAVLIFSIAHCITDGTYNIRICREIVFILNKISKGQHVESNFVPLSPSENYKINSWSQFIFIGKYIIDFVFVRLFRNFYKKSSFQGAFQVPMTKEITTKFVYHEFSEEETKILIERCRAEKVTVHSFITAITNCALLKVTESRSHTLDDNTYIYHGHFVDLRRHTDDPNFPIDANGCHVSYMEGITKHSLADAEDFWNTARRLHGDFKNKLEVQKAPHILKRTAGFFILFYIVNFFFTRKGWKNKTFCHYCTTNMGNLKNLLPINNEEKDIKISNLLRCVSTHLSGCPFALTFHTFKDKFMISIDSSENRMKHENVEEIFQMLCLSIRDIINFNSL